MLTLHIAEQLCAKVQERAVEHGLAPIAIVIIDSGGHMVLAKREDGATMIRIDVATAKAWTALSLGSPSRAFAEVAKERPQFAAALGQLSPIGMIPAAGGLLIVDHGQVLGAIGVSGDTSDNDETVGLDALSAEGFDVA